MGARARAALGAALVVALAGGAALLVGPEEPTARLSDRPARPRPAEVAPGAGPVPTARDPRAAPPVEAQAGPAGADAVSASATAPLASGSGPDPAVVDSPLAVHPEDAARAAELLERLAGEDDPLAALIVGEELGPLVAALPPEGAGRLLALAGRDGAARQAALAACGRLDPGAETVEAVRRLSQERSSPALREAGLDALRTLAARGAPARAVELAMAELSHPGWGR